MAKRDIVVIGASAGGMSSLRELVGALPSGLPACLFVVWHLAPGTRTTLPRVLSKAGPLPAREARDGEEPEPGTIYTAPSDCHMLLERGVIRIAHGPKENRFRPAVDPLFRSAAYIYGPRAVGVVLSGALDDGTSGLWTIKLRGGTALVQDPDEAEFPAMPKNAMAAVEVDYCGPAAKIGERLGRIVREEAPPAPRIATEENRRTETELRIAEGGRGAAEILSEGALTPFTCPECRGVLVRVNEGKASRYRCHTGHAFSAVSLAESLAESVEDRLWDAVRALDEASVLLGQLGRPEDAKRAAQRAEELRRTAMAGFPA